MNWKEQTTRLDQNYKEPRFALEELLGIIPKDPKQPFDERDRGSYY